MVKQSSEATGSPCDYLCMTVLASLRSGHFNNFAGATLKHHEPVLAQGAALHGVGGRSPCITAGEIKIWICHDGVLIKGHWGGGGRERIYIGHENACVCTTVSYTKQTRK